MLGRNHVYGGMLSSFLLLSVKNNNLVHELGILNYSHFNKLELFTYVLIGGGAALISDIDSENSYITQSFGFISGGISKFIGNVNRHRGFTHTILFALLIYISSLSLMHWKMVEHLTVAYLTGMAIYINIFSFKPFLYFINRTINKLPIFIFLCIYGIFFFLKFHTQLNIHQIALHISFGILSHIILDTCTLGGCQMFWPLYKGNIALSKMRVGGEFEKKVITPILLSSIIFSIIKEF